MPQDLITIQAIAEELKDKLIGGRIDKISEPEQDELMLIIRNEGINYSLVMSSNPNIPRIHITLSKKFNPYAAPSFCMLMRKYLSNGMINNISIVNNDRIVKLDIASKNELYDIINLSIIVELMGRYSNIIFINEEGIIIDAIKHIPPDDKGGRIILPNIRYTPPINNKINNLDYTAIEELITAFNGDDFVKLLIENVSGISSLTAHEIISNSKALNSDTIISSLKEFNNINNSSKFMPCVVYNEQSQISDYMLFPYKGVDKFKPCKTINEAADIFYTNKDKQDRLRQASKDIVNLLKNSIKRLERALTSIEEKLLECEGAEAYRQYGDIILANIYRISKGMSELIADNFFSEGQVIIPLDIALSPQKNAERYYRKFSKLSRSKSVVIKQREEVLNNIQYLNSVMNNINIAEGSEDIEAIKEELIEEKYLPNKNKKTKNSPRRQLREIEYKGYKIIVGRNNIENDHITFKIASKGDLFLHAQKAHGSHAIILAEGRSIPDVVIEKGAKLAAYYSTLRNADKAAVDYTLRQNVRKHPSAKKGMVIYTDYKTAYVKPEDIS